VSARRPVAGVMGAGDGASGADILLAERLGELLARAGFVVLTGGRDAGVMAAATRGAKRVPESLTVGVLPGNGGPVAEGLELGFVGVVQQASAV
jgi:predicted Rossmann-fold nucleotide-binding protein